VTIIDDPIPIASALLGRRAEIELLLAYGEEARCRLAIRGSALLMARRRLLLSS
jgi:hypothetical protein